MFKLVVMVYLLSLPTNQPVGDPVKFVNKAEFATQEECMAHPKDGKGADEYNALMNNIAKMVPDGHSVTATTSCEKRGDDGSI